MSDLKVDGIIASTGSNTDLELSGKGTGGVKITDYLIQTKGSDIASATALTLGKDANLFDVTGTTTITSIATQGIGSVVTLHFDGALTFTHHSTNLILPGAASITTAAGDIAVMYEYASADWRCINYTKASGAAVVAGGGAWNFIATSTASDSASLTVDGMSDTYDSYAIIGSQLLPVTDNVDAWMRFGDGSIDSGSTDYSYTQRGQYLTNFYTTGSDGAAQMIMTSYSDGIGNATGEGYGFIAYIFQPSGGAQRTWMSGHGASLSTNNINFFVHRFGGARRSTISHTQVNFLFSSGNVTSGRLTLWGIAHA